MKSLLDRLKRGLRELGQNPRDHARTQIDRAGDRRDGDAAPQRRSENEAASQTPGNGHPQQPGDKLPPQQPAPPSSTRLKKAVLSKARRSAAPRQATTIWGAGPTASSQANSWLGAPAGDQQPALLTGANLAGVDPDPKASPNVAPASSHGGFFGGAAHHSAPVHDHALWSPPATAASSPPPPFGAAPVEGQPPPSLLDGAPSFGRSDDVAPPSDRLF